MPDSKKQAKIQPNKSSSGPKHKNSKSSRRKHSKPPTENSKVAPCDKTPETTRVKSAPSKIIKPRKPRQAKCSVPLLEKSPEPTYEPPSEPLLKKSPDPISEKPSEILVEKSPDPISEKPSEILVEKSPDPLSEKPSEILVEKSPDPICEKPSEILVEKSPDPISEKPSKILVEKSPDPIIEKPSEILVEKSPDPISEKPSEILVEKSPDPICEKPSEILVEKSAVKSPPATPHQKISKLILLDILKREDQKYEGIDFDVPPPEWSKEDKRKMRQVMRSMTLEAKKQKNKDRVSAISRQLRNFGFVEIGLAREIVGLLQKDTNLMNHMELKHVAFSTFSKNNYDWDEIAKLVNSKHTPIECKEYWYMNLYPNIKNMGFSHDNDKQLMKLAIENNFQNWDKIADQMIAHTEFQCYVHFRRNLYKKMKNKVKKST